MNFSLSFGGHVVLVFILVLSMILASAFYKYTNNFRQRFADENDFSFDILADESETSDFRQELDPIEEETMYPYISDETETFLMNEIDD